MSKNKNLKGITDYQELLDILGWTIKETCGACPEQYDLFDSKQNQVGYIRLRWGYLSVESPDYDGKTVYAFEFIDDMKGCFDSDTERNHHLCKAIKAVWGYVQ